jgi:serine/threonine-protein kinase RsbW
MMRSKVTDLSDFEVYMKSRIKLEVILPGQTRYLSLIGKIGNILTKDLCIPYVDRESLCNTINSVLTEAIVNTIKHGHLNSANRDVKVFISISNFDLIIKVFDTGQGFDLTSIPNTAFDTDLLKECGRGINIIRSLMDSIEYDKSANCNVLIMKKALD